MAKRSFKAVCVIALSIHVARFAEGLSSVNITPKKVSIPSSAEASRTTRKRVFLETESSSIAPAESEELLKKKRGPYRETGLAVPPARSLTVQGELGRLPGRRVPPGRLREDPMPLENEEFFDASEYFESPPWYRSMSSSVSSIVGRLVHGHDRRKGPTDLQTPPLPMKLARTERSSEKLEQTAKSVSYHSSTRQAISKTDVEELHPSASSSTRISKAEVASQSPLTSSSTKKTKFNPEDLRPSTSSSKNSKSDVKDLQPSTSSSIKTPHAKVGDPNLSASSSTKNPPDELRYLVNDLLTDFMRKNISPDQSAQAVDGAFRKSNRVTQWASRQVPPSVWHWLLTSKILPRLTDRVSGWLVGSLKENLGNEKAIAAVQDQLQEIHRATHEV